MLDGTVDEPELAAALDADEAELAALEPDVEVALDDCLVTAWPSVGKATLPLTSQRPLV